MKISMIGAGYVGLTTSTCLAQLGHEVSCHDVDEDRLVNLTKGRLPLFEPGLAGAVAAARRAGKLEFTSSLQDCVADAQAVFLAVGTPSGPGGDIDLTDIEHAARQISPYLMSGAVVVVKSTVVVGTCTRLRKIIATARRSTDFSVASNPEFLREGSALQDFMCPDRVVIGVDDGHSQAVLSDIYRPMIDDGVPMMFTGSTNAELIKYAANAFLALKIGFINDVANLCEKAGGDVSAIAAGIGLDRRIGAAFLTAGPGYGGSCFPKDTRAFAHTGRSYGAPQLLIEALIARNEDRKLMLAQRISSDRSLPRGATVTVLGVAFKANTDDVRESAALTIVPNLQKAGFKVRAHDPKAMANATAHLHGVHWCECPYQACEGAGAVVILTEWEDYRGLDLARLAQAMHGSLLFDFRNLLSPDEAAANGLRYVGIGRPVAADLARFDVADRLAATG